ncbi:MAG: two-component regulator propeller domain-containing protein [Flavobacteriales bacterium]
MNKAAHLGIFLLLLLIGGPLEAQVPAALSGNALRFQHITTANGLTDNAVTCLLEDRAGYIWIGTEHGLNKYDGQRVLRYSGASGPTGIRISSIAQDSSGTIWVASTDGGLSRYDANKDSFSGFMQVNDASGALPTDRLNHLLALNDSILVISTQNACLLWCNTKDRTFRRRDYNTTADTRDRVIHDTIGRWCHSTLRLDKDRIWLGLIPGKNSLILDAWNGNVLRDIRSSNADSLHSLTNAILFNGNILAGGWGPGISRIQLDHWDKQAYYSFGDEITAIVPWRNGSMLAGTKINGLLLLGKQLQIIGREKHHRNDRASIGDNQVRCLLNDRHGNLWVGTGGGISVHAPAVWPMAVKELLPDDGLEQPDLTFHNLQQAADGTIRISSSHGFFTLKDPQAAPRHISLSLEGRDLEVTGLFNTGPNEYFIGTETGLFPYDFAQEQLDMHSRPLFHSPFPTISMFQVRSVIADTIAGRRHILVGALGFGMSILDPSTLEYKKEDFKLVMDPSLSLTGCTVRDSVTGRYWSGSSKGLYSWAPRHGAVVDTPLTFLKSSPPDRRLPGEDVRALAVRGNTTWATLREGALVAIVNDKVKAYSVPKHLPSDLQGLAFDKQGRVWCTTSNGLLRFDPRDGSWLHVPVNDGGRFRQLNRCILQLRDGTMAFCADNCLVTFHPDAFDHLPPLPIPVLTGIRNAWGPLTTDGKGRLQMPSRGSSFEADLSALSPTGPAPLEFLYRLEGIEEVSHVTTGAAPLRYAGVPPGDLRLLVRVRDAYGREGPELAVLTLSIAAPIWQRWWAYALLALLVGGAMYAWSRYRLRQAMKFQAVRDGIARDLHDDIGSTLGSISYYSEALKRRLGEQDPIAKEVADKIGANSREMIGRMSDIVWSVDPKNDDAGSLSERMKMHAADLLAARGIELGFHQSPDLNAHHLSTPLRRSLFLIYKEAMHNAMKYSGCNKMEISLICDDRSISMTIADNGSGFDTDNVDSYNGNGLPSIRARAESLGGKVDVTSSADVGTRVHVKLPYSDGITRSGD